MAGVDVLIPTFRRPAALAVTLATLVGQTFTDFRVVVADQTEEGDSLASGEVQAVARVLRARGHVCELLRNLPRRGMAQQRDFLLARAQARYALFLDDDLVLEPGVIAQMVSALDAEGCGFVGCAVHGLSFAQDIRPHQQTIEFWDRRVEPEVVRPGSPAWQRHHLHSAANLWHVQRRLEPGETRRYRVAWVGACVLYDVAKLRDVGGFGFWRELPPVHCGEDVLAQLRVMSRFGGCGLLPSGVYHQELTTTVHDRRTDAPYVLPIDPSAASSVGAAA